MGLLVLEHLPDLVARRRAIVDVYRARLAGIPGIRLPPVPPADVKWNCAYMPVEIMPEFPLSRDALYERLKTFNVFSRRYFYPLLTAFPCYRGLPRRDPLCVADGVARRILTLPIYHELAPDDVHRIGDIIQEVGYGS
jgi:dTDP-4-amino-4,6-dideoxygalactose transaminase